MPDDDDSHPSKDPGTSGAHTRRTMPNPDTQPIPTPKGREIPHPWVRDPNSSAELPLYWLTGRPRMRKRFEYIQDPELGSFIWQVPLPRKRKATRVDILGLVLAPVGPFDVFIRTYDKWGFIVRRAKPLAVVLKLARQAKVRVLVRDPTSSKLVWRALPRLSGPPYDLLRRRAEIPFWRRSPSTGRWHFSRSAQVASPPSGTGAKPASLAATTQRNLGQIPRPTARRER